MHKQELPIEDSLDALYALNSISHLNHNSAILGEQITLQHYLWTAEYPLDGYMARELTDRGLFAKQMLREHYLDKVYNHFIFIEESQEALVINLQAQLEQVPQGVLTSLHDRATREAVKDAAANLLLTRKEEMTSLEQALALTIDLYQTSKNNNEYHNVVSLYLGLAELYQKMDANKMLRHAQAMVTFIENQKGTAYIDTINAYYRLGATHEFLGNPIKAQQVYEHALELETQSGQVNSYPSSIVLLKKSVLYNTLATDAYLNKYGENALETAAAYANLGNAYLEAQDPENGYKSLTKAWILYKSLNNHLGERICAEHLGQRVRQGV